MLASRRGLCFSYIHRRFKCSKSRKPICRVQTGQHGSHGTSRVAFLLPCTVHKSTTNTRIVDHSAIPHTNMDLSHLEQLVIEAIELLLPPPIEGNQNTNPHTQPIPIRPCSSGRSFDWQPVKGGPMATTKEQTVACWIDQPTTKKETVCPSRPFEHLNNQSHAQIEKKKTQKQNLDTLTTHHPLHPDYN